MNINKASIIPIEIKEDIDFDSTAIIIDINLRDLRILIVLKALKALNILMLLNVWNDFDPPPYIISINDIDTIEPSKMFIVS